jgi:uncharacterized lipoprotein YajG
MYINRSAGYVTAKENYMRKLFLIGSFILLTGCSEFALLMSGSSLALSQNTYAKAYNAVDFGVTITTKKGIKQHAYTQGKKYLEELAKAKATGKKYIVDYARAKALGIMSNH